MYEFNDWLKARGIDPEGLDLAVKTTLESAWRTEQNPQPTPAPQPAPAASAPTQTSDVSFASKVAELRAETERVEGIRSRTLDVMTKWVGNAQKQAELQSLCDAAVADKKVDLKSFELELIRANSLGAGPVCYAPSKPQVTGEVLEAALCKAGGLRNIEAHFDERTLSAADKRFRRGIGLHELIGTCARANGWRGESVKQDMRNAMRFAFGDFGGGPMAIGPSSFDVSGILGNTANKYIKQHFDFVESAWREICAIRSVPDFKQITVYTMDANLKYTKLAPGGQIQHGTASEESYTNQADTYAKLFAIDRRDIINDDLGAFTGLMAKMGRGGALAINDVFWTEFLDETSGTFWTAGRGNFDDGTDTAFTNDGLVAADVIWSAKTDPSGYPLGIMARKLLVPPTLRIPALRLMNSQELLAAGEEGNVNPWSGKFDVVSSVYMENSNYTGYSTKAWYLIADPMDMAVIEGVFLDGQQMPTVETVDLSADRLGFAIRAYHDFGFNKAEYRAALKLKGEA